jgi:hypothetical protein
LRQIGSFTNESHLPTDDGINNYLNENWKVALDALKPIISKAIVDIMLTFVQNIFHHIPGDYIIPDVPRANEIGG